MVKWIVLLALSTSLFAEMQNHYILGSHGINSAIKPDPGYDYIEIYSLYQVKQLNNQKGDKVHLKGSKRQLDVRYLQNIFGYYSPYKIFRASWGMQINIPCETASIDQAYFYSSFQGLRKKMKLSDIYVEPFNIRWNWGRLYFFWAYGVYTPTGKFHHFSKKNTGLGDWGQLFTGAFTLFFDQGKTFSVSAYSNYEIHSKKRGMDFRAGDNFCLDWGVGKTFDKVLTIGAVGYYERQPHPDKGNDVPKSSRHVRDKVLSAGPEVDLFVPQMNGHLTARYEVEFEAIARTKGRMITLEAIFNF
jgi:hypothetical protein